MREQPQSLLTRLQEIVDHRNQIVISAITYAELRFGAIGKKASPKHNLIVNQFLERIDAILPWDKAAVEASTDIKKNLSDRGSPIGINDTNIAGHAIASDCTLVTNNTREFQRVPGLILEDWSKP